MAISISSIEQLFRNASDATVLGRFASGVDDTGVFQLEFMNNSAVCLLGLSESPPPGLPLTGLLSAESLTASLLHTYQSGNSTTGCLSQTGKQLVYEITLLGDWLAIRLENSESTQSLEEAIGKHLLATKHLAVALLHPIHNSSKQLTDFRLAALYDRDSQLSTWYDNGIPIGKLLSEWNPETKKDGLFEQYVAVIETGLPFQGEKYYQGINTAFDVAASRFGNQLLLTFNRTTETYQAKQQVEQQAALLEAIMQSTQDYISVYQAIRDESGRITDFKGLLFSEALYQLSGLTKEDFLTRSLRELHPTTAALFDDYVTLVQTGIPMRAERVLAGQDTGTRWFDVSSSKVLDGFVSISKDITSHKLSHQQVDTQSQMLEAILNNSDSFIYLAEPVRDDAGQVIDFRIARSNEAGRQNMIRTVGYDGTGSNLLTLYPFSRQQGLFDEYVKVVETGQPMATEFYYEYKHIREWMKISAQQMGDGLVVTYVDISESRKAAEKAEKYAQQLKGVLDASLNGIILLEAIRDEQDQVIDFRYLLANESASKINGVPLDQLLGNTLLTLFPSSKAEGSFPQNVYALTTGNPIRKQLKLYCDRMEGWYDFTSNRINANNLVVSFTNITETKALEERQQKLVEALRRSNANLQEFAYVASHDLQEPLRKITSYGGILKNQYAPLLGEEGLDFVERMETASLRMSSLIKDLLAYSRLSLQTQPLQPQALSQVVREVLADLDMAIQDKEAIVEVDDLFTIPGDATQLAQLFQNLLTNALKFTKTGVCPHIQIGSRIINRQELPRDLELLTNHETYGLIQVSDNGIGFDPVQGERIFGTFQRLHGKGAYPGTGIGLAIAKKVVQNHSGAIRAEGRLGEGATFSIYLPL
ncbi:MAG: hypothetical protein JWP57_2134 [Spirosoma sp.]|nr:hypothetical protein [Spirosoma sp.]